MEPDHKADKADAWRLKFNDSKVKDPLTKAIDQDG